MPPDGKLCGVVVLSSTTQVTHYRSVIADILEHSEFFSAADLHFCHQHEFIFDRYGVETLFTVFTQRWFKRLEHQILEVLDLPATSDL